MDGRGGSDVRHITAVTRRLFSPLALCDWASAAETWRHCCGWVATSPGSHNTACLREGPLPYRVDARGGSFPDFWAVIHEQARL